MELCYSDIKHFDDKLDAILANQETIITNQGAIMANIDQVLQNLDDMHDLVSQILDVIAAGDAERVALRQQVTDLIAAANIAQAAKDALQAQIDTAFDKSETVENSLRSVVPGVPPVGGEPLAPSYASRAEFDTALAAYTGPEAVTVSGAEVRAGTSPSIDYFEHTVDGSISTSGPSD